MRQPSGGAEYQRNCMRLRIDNCCHLSMLNLVDVVVL